jgi:hypothetical protein
LPARGVLPRIGHRIADLLRGRDVTTVTITRKDTGGGTIGFDHWGGSSSV